MGQRATASRASGGGKRASRPYHHGALRGALVDAAAQLAAEKGPAAVSLREVARRAGVSQAAPYHYFADKAALLAAVAEEGFHQFDASQAAAVASGDDPTERLGALGASYVRFALDRPHYFKVMFRQHLFAPEKFPSLQQVAGRTFERLVETVRAARQAHGHDDLDPLAAATLVWAVPHGLALLYLDGPVASGTTPHALEGLARAAAAALASAPLDEVTVAEHWGI